MKKLSIIVPVYNVEPYVERCIRSLESQNIKEEDFEVICVNDGSLDKSEEVIIKLQKEFNNIILINQDNKGVSFARNVGIDKACGKYIMFVDSDDYIDKNSLLSVLENAENNKAQVSFLDYAVVDDTGIISKSLHKQDKGNIFTGIHSYFLSRGDNHSDPDRIWSILYELEFINENKFRFLPNVPYLEDGEFIARVLCIARRCSFIDHLFYFRYERSGSATNSNLFHSSKSTNGFLLAVSSLMKFQENSSLSSEQKDFLNQPICKYVILVIYSVQRPFKLKRLSQIRANLVEIGIDKLELSSLTREYAKLGYLFNRSVYLMVFYQIITNKMKYLLNLLKL